jgi:hypothetical protein
VSLEHMIAFYDSLSRLEACCHGAKTLEQCSARMGWPRRGVYFFFEAGEVRSGSGEGLRVVRVGTHAVTSASKSTLWNRLAQHRSGNSKGSVFRKLVGAAIAERNAALGVPMLGEVPFAASRKGGVEAEISRHICRMPFLWLAVEDAPSPESMRALIERNSIALLSAVGGANGVALDPQSVSWLGRRSPSEDVRQSGLWNSHHVRERYDPRFLELLHTAVSRMALRGCDR